MIDFRDDEVRNRIKLGVKTDINEWWKTQRINKFKTRISPSSVGEECAAATFFDFHWVTAPGEADGRMARYNSRGEENEANFVSWLRATGWTVEEIDPATGKQWAVAAFHNHLYGKCDGIASHSIYTNGERVLLEFKYINYKRFTTLTTKALIIEDLKYYCQVQIYLKELGLPAAIFMPANRNDEDFEPIVIPYDPAQLDIVYKKIETILSTKTIPAKIAQSAAFFKCKFCDHVGVCHNGQAPAVNCRSCISCVPTFNGEFYCEKWNAQIPKDTIKTGCQSWVSII
jgi:hypothetical protein